MEKNEVTQENWKPISADTSYEISDLGRLRHHYQNGNTIILKPKSNGNNSKYLFYTICGVKYYAHHLVAHYFIGTRPVEFEVDHLDRNPRNNKLDNLRYLHYTENRLRGNDHPNARLTEQHVKVIRQMAKLNGFTKKQIAEIFGITAPAVYNITSGRRWKHVQ